MRKELLHITLACLAGLLLIGALVEFRQRSKQESATKPDCVEQPSIALPLKNLTITPHHGSRLHVCGIRDRAGLPSTIQCYEMKDGCTE